MARDVDRSLAGQLQPAQWLAGVTLACAGGGTILEFARIDRAWSVYVTSVVGLVAGVLAFRRSRRGAQFGVAWGVLQTLVLVTGTLDDRGLVWIGRQFLYVFAFTRSTDPQSVDGSTVALNLIGPFWAFTWAWFGYQKHFWTGGQPAQAGSSKRAQPG